MKDITVFPKKKMKTKSKYGRQQYKNSPEIEKTKAG